MSCCVVGLLSYNRNQLINPLTHQPKFVTNTIFMSSQKGIVYSKAIPFFVFITHLIYGISHQQPL